MYGCRTDFSKKLRNIFGQFGYYEIVIIIGELCYLDRFFSHYITQLIAGPSGYQFGHLTPCGKPFT